MARVCELTGTRPRTGNHVSHSKRAVKRRFDPNLQSISFFSEVLGSSVRLTVTTRAVRTVQKRGGLDAFLLTMDDRKLPEPAQQLKRRIRKAMARKRAAASKSA